MVMPDISLLGLTSPIPTFAGPSPALTHVSLDSQSSESIYDFSLSTALSHLIHHLIKPLAPLYNHSTISALRYELARLLRLLYQDSWDERSPQHGTGFRSLICNDQHGLPRVMKTAAKATGIDEASWRKCLSGGKRNDEEWEAWCDPGQVVWRFGGWEWEDVGFEPGKIIRDKFIVIWQATAESASVPKSQVQSILALTPSRPSHAIPIRAPTVFQIPPTPLAPTESEVPQAESPSLLPAVNIGHQRISSLDISRGPSPSNSDISSNSEYVLSCPSDSEYDIPDQRPRSSASSRSLGERQTERERQRSNHSHNGSTSSISSSISDSNSGRTQLLTPATRPSSADPFVVPSLPIRKTTPISRGRTPSPSTPTTPLTDTSSTPSGTTIVPTPSVTPYDGGNVTVLGGGVKLGGGGGGGVGSRPSSVMSSNRIPLDRTRSPSVSIASRALNTALGPNANSNGNSSQPPTSPRKQRIRKRIIPTYLGTLQQPGLGPGASQGYGQFVPKVQPGGYQPGGNWLLHPNGGGGGMASQMGMRTMTLGQRMA